MVHRIFRSILSAAIVTLLDCLVIITGILYRHSAEEQHTQLGNQLVLAVSAVEKNGLSYLDSLKLRDSRITWIAADGTVLFDSEADVSAMENHAGREEVKLALSFFPGDDPVVLYFEDTRIRRGTRCALDSRMTDELVRVLAKENVVLK